MKEVHRVPLDANGGGCDGEEDDVPRLVRGERREIGVGRCVEEAGDER